MTTGAQRKLQCVDDNVSAKQWRACLVEVDHDIMSMLDRAAENGIVLMSLPYSQSQIREGMGQLVDSVGEHAFSFCCDAIIEFLVSNGRSARPKADVKSTQKWDPAQFERMLDTESVLVIDSRTGHFVSIPREVSALHLEWEMTWACAKHDHVFADILDAVCGRIALQCFPSHFDLSPDWAKRTDFSVDTDPYIGYVAEDGVVIRGDLLRVNRPNTKIFIHFNQAPGHLTGDKYQWILIPNDRICPPPATRPKPVSQPVSRSFETTDDQINSMASSFNQVDNELQRAIAASLQER